MSIRVLLADDQELVRAGFRIILETDQEIEVVGEAGDGQAAIRLCEELRPDVICMDVQMPGMDGLAATRQIVARPDLAASVLVLTTFNRDDYLFTALQAGASGFLLKNSTPEELVNAVHVLARGDALLSPDVTRQVISRFSAATEDVRGLAGQDTVPPAAVGDLTEREREVLGLLAAGLSNAEIARRLYLGEATVKTEVSAVVVPAAGTPPVTVIGLDSAPQSVLAALSIQPEVELLDPSAQPAALVYIIALGFGIVFMMSAVTFGTMIAQSVVEEKQTRVVEILLSTVSARVLLAGKVIGNSVLALGQIAAIAVAAVLGMMITGQQVLLGTVGPAVAWFVVFFVIGFVLLAALYAAAASLVSRSEDIGSVTSPVMILIMVPYFLVIFFNDNPTVMAIMSYVPFSAPVGMPVRIFLGTAEWWEPLLSLVVLLASTAVVIALGARVYSNSLLRTGARVKVSDALRG